jgi:phosphatidylserine/phosphatidylglycerophosphate/cardiolipin synthase-like enzyme
MESRNAHGTGAEFDRLRSAGVVVLEDGNCYVMHHKAFVVDGRHVVTGSFNWSAQAQSSNDENVIIVDNAWFARRYQDEFEQIYDQARTPDRCGG